MNTISKYQMAEILEYLDDVAAALPPSPVPGLESTSAWCIRMARKRLHTAALIDVAVEPAAAEVA